MAAISLGADGPDNCDIGRVRFFGYNTVLAVLRDKLGFSLCGHEWDLTEVR